MDNFDQVMMRRFVDDNITSRDIRPLEIPTDRTGADLAEKMREPDTLQEADILRDRQFAQNAKDIHKLYEGKDFVGTDREAAEYGLEIMGEFYFNFAGPGIGDNPGTVMQAATLIASGTEDTAKSFLYMLDQYEQLPNWTGSGLYRAFNGIFSDPSTYAGLFTLGSAWVAKKLASGAAREGVRLSLQNIAKDALAQKGVVGAVTRTAAEYPARVTAGTTAFQGGVSDVAEQSIEVEAGIERDVTDRIAQNLLVTGISGAAGYGLAKGAGVVGDVLSDAASAAAPIIDQAGQAAEARMAERGPITDRVMSGADPMEVIDPALAAAGKLVRPTKENPVTAVPPTETEPGIIAFHGSGADFDQFSLEKIGTGEGAQAYGYGLYFTDSEDIAKFYRDAVGGKNINRIKQFDDIGQALKGKMTLTTDIINNIIDKKIKVSSLPKEAQSLVKEILKRKEPPTIKKIYKVGLAPKTGELLDYDAPFSEQSKDVQEKLLKAGYKVDANTSGSGGMILEAIMSDIAKKETAPRSARLDEINAELKVLAKEIDKYSTTGYRNFTDPKGEAAAEKYDALMDERANLPKFSKSDARKIASEKIAKAGIPGIKYKAAGSRAANLDAADAEMNYVIFDDKAIKILEKYGIVGPVAITALGAEKQDGEEM
jgi:hypothetical protein